MAALVLMACSATKGPRPVPAFELYRGVMYTTFRANSGETPPPVIILSAEHGFIDARLVLSPYERRMDRQRSDEMLDDPASFDHAAWPAATEVMLAGGKLYRRVMRAELARRIARGTIVQDVLVSETTGGIGVQRAQLGAWLHRVSAGGR